LDYENKSGLYRDPFQKYLDAQKENNSAIALKVVKKTIEPPIMNGSL
jgi:hypothetical protein